MARCPRQRATVFVNRQRRGNPPQLEGGIQREQRRGLNFIAQRVAVIDRAADRAIPTRAASCRRATTPARRRGATRAAAARPAWRAAADPRSVPRAAVRRSRPTPSRCLHARHRTRSRMLSGAHDGYDFVAAHARDAIRAQRLAVGSDRLHGRRTGFGGRGPERNRLRNRRGRDRHPPQIEVVFRIALGNERHLGAVRRHARIGFAIGRLGQRERRLPRLGSGHRRRKVQVVLQAGIAVAARWRAHRDAQTRGGHQRSTMATAHHPPWSSPQPRGRRQRRS